MFFTDLVKKLFNPPIPSPRFATIDKVDTEFGKSEVDLEAKLVEAGRKAVAFAEEYWKQDIFDPKKGGKYDPADVKRSLSVITEIVKLAGWSWEVPYTHDGQVQWCGMFAAACWRKAGINPSFLATFWASTARLTAWVNYKKWNDTKNPKPPKGPYRQTVKITRETRALPFTPREGDILVVGDGHPADGDHITLVISYDPLKRVFHTIEGNGGGVGPKGNRREGVVKAERYIDAAGYVAMWLHRPAPSDLIQE